MVYKHDPNKTKAENWELFKAWSDKRINKILEKYKSGDGDLAAFKEHAEEVARGE